MNFERRTRQLMWFFASVCDVVWLFICFSAGLPIIGMIFLFRLWLDAVAFGQSFSPKTTESDHLRFVAAWLWLGACAGLMTGNVFLFILLSVASGGLYYVAAKAEEARRKD